MKKFLCLLMSLLMIMSLVACGQSAKPAPAPEADAQVEAAPEAKEPEVVKLTIGGPHSESFSWIAACEEFFFPYVDEALAKNGNYVIEWNRAWGGTICKYDETLEAVESRLLDIGLTATTGEVAKLLFPNMTYYVPFNTTNVPAARQAYEDLKAEFPEIAAEFEKYNQKLLGSITIEAYNIAAKFAADGPEDFDGKKVGASGPNLRWLDNTGAGAVTNNGTEAYSSLQTGVIDATMQHMGMLYTLQLYEQGQNILVGNFGAPSMLSMSINLDCYNELPEEVKNVLVEAGEHYSKMTAEYSMNLYETAIAEMEKWGATIVYMEDQARADWCAMLPNLPQEYAKVLTDAGYDGTAVVTRYLELLEENGQPQTRDWMNE